MRPEEEEWLHDAEAVIAWVDKRHADFAWARRDTMALLLTELSDPASLARVIDVDLASERRDLTKLLELVGKPIEPWDVDPDSANRMPEPPDPFRRQREVLTRTLELVNADQARCAARLAARKADMQAGLPLRNPDPDEEPDPLERIYATSLRERTPSPADRAAHAKNEEGMQKRVDQQREASPWNR